MCSLSYLHWQHHLKLYQMDVVSTYLIAPIDVDMFIRPPPGVEVAEGMAWKMKKSLYGLKQAPCNWNRTMDAYLTGT